MKPVKAIDLVWKAQPMITTLHTIMVKIAADKPGKSAAGTVAEDAGQWLASARELLTRKGMQWPADTGAQEPPAPQEPKQE